MKHEPLGRTLATSGDGDENLAKHTVTVDAGHSKRRRQDVQPIRDDLAELLRQWLAERPRGERLFKLPHSTAKMFRRDMEVARAQWLAAEPEGPERVRREQSDFLLYRDAVGRVADFHALRHTYVSGIVASGASVRTAQELVRHSTPVLTIGRYSHTRLHDLTAALHGLPDQRPTVHHDGMPCRPREPISFCQQIASS